MLQHLLYPVQELGLLLSPYRPGVSSGPSCHCQSLPAGTAGSVVKADTVGRALLAQIPLCGFSLGLIGCIVGMFFLARCPGRWGIAWTAGGHGLWPQGIYCVEHLHTLVVPKGDGCSAEVSF